MSLPRYPKYKDSGVELGQVPAHWRVNVIKRFSTLHRGYDLTEDERTSGEYPVVTSGGPSGHHGSFKAHGPGVVTGRYGSTGRLFYITEDYWPHNTALYVSDFHHNLPRFVWYSLQTIDFPAHSAKAAVPGIDRNDIHVLPVAIPSLPEQTKVVEFLDLETAKIEALVAEQQRLMDLLQEKRQAVISYAVTRGMDPEAPMKASGIPWLGAVPAHWDLTRLKYLGEAITGLTYAPSEVTNDECTGTLVLRSSNVQGGKITHDDNVFVTSHIPDALVTRPGDILICSRNGSRALIGKNATIDARSANCTFGAFMTIFRSEFSSYIACVLNSTLFEYQAGAFMTSTINQLTLGVLNNLEVPLPPANERAQIAEFVSRTTARLETLIAEAQRAIDLLQERRTALISAAVTGQIDVRHLA